MTFKQLLDKNFIILDGAMGTMLQKSGLAAGDIPEILNVTNPGLIKNIHRSYAQSGADIIYANTFGANRFKLSESGYSLDFIIASGIKNARDAAKDFGCLTALDIGSLGRLLEPLGQLSFETAYECFKEIVLAGSAAGADLIVIETMTDLLEAKAALLAARENSDLPVICTMTFEKNMRTFTGADISSMALTLDGLGADAIGVNCSLGPRDMKPLIEELSRWTDLPLAVKPNAGLPDPESGIYNVDPEEFASCMAPLSSLGVKFFGGCCGTTPEYIKLLRNKLSEISSWNLLKKDIPSAVCSPGQTVIIDCPKIIGERINPTGKKLFKEALRKKDISYIVSQALEQTSAGADILDVNVGLPEIDEKEMMVSSIKAIQNATSAPLQIDSTIPEVIEAALRIYSGKPIVNSVNGDEESMSVILPLVKKYGASVVCLTLDSNGIPSRAEDRFHIARRIMDRALSLGIPKRDIYIDCLTLTASAEQEAVMETLKAVKMVKEQLGLKTVLGVSNISFGLPCRELINHSFLAMALAYGLDLPIINPNIPSMAGTVRSYRLLANYDKNASAFLKAYGDSQYTAPKISGPAQEQKASGQNVPELQDIYGKLLYSIEKGLSDDGAKYTKELLCSVKPMDIIDNCLIPALDSVGNKFETGKIFLPQLILSANAAQACFGVIKDFLSQSSEKTVSKGKIIIATVKGDIHDIGKNIVKVLLENYGYEVIDLGKDVDPELIVSEALSQNVSLVGLSALMTTTLKSMENTISLLRSKNVPCKIMVGGAVLTKEYADKIGADFFARDAKESVDIARAHFGNN